MKPIIIVSAFFALFTATAVYAAAPETVANAAKACCDAVAACCDKPCCDK